MYKQIVPRDETETLINIDYEGKIIKIYTSRAVVMNRMERKGYIPAKIHTAGGETEALEWEFPVKDMAKFLRADIFSFNTTDTPSANTEEIEISEDE